MTTQPPASDAATVERCAQIAYRVCAETRHVALGDRVSDEIRALPTRTADDSFQSRVHPWLHECFGAEISADVTERNHRFLEEALELVQSTGCTKSEAHQLVDYVYDRPVGEPKQEVGGVMVTLAALCLAADLDMHECGEAELARIWTKVEKIRAKQAAKPKHSPLPQHVSTADEGALVEAWQTMETAPKDGSWFLACGGIYNGLPFCARYDNRFADGDCWEVKFAGRPMRHCVQYWKPLPPMPPSLTAHGKGE